MASRRYSIRTRIVFLLAVPLIALLALWAVAASASLGDALLLLKARALQSKLVEPTQALVSGLQAERRLSLAYLGAGAQADHSALDKVRAQNDQLRAEFKTDVASPSLHGIQDTVLARANTLAGRLSEIDGLRPSIIAGAMGRQPVLDEFESLIDAAFSIYDAVSPGNAEISLDARTLTTLARGRELISREDALVTGVLSAGRMTVAERDEIAQLSGGYRNFYGSAIPLLRTSDQANFSRLMNTPDVVQWQNLETTLIRSPAGGRPDVTLTQWSTLTLPVTKGFYDAENTALDGVTGRAQSIALEVLFRLLLTGGLGLVAVIASIVIAVRIARRIIREARTLAKAVGEFSKDELPGIAQRVREGELIEEADTGLGAGDFQVKEIHRLSNAFDDAKIAVVQAARREAAARNGVSDLFINLARRNQALLHRQLGLLDTMERRAEEPDELDDLFRLDHLATCMRRHAEGLVILAGKTAGRTWRTPVPLLDVARGAVAEVEDYKRVRVHQMPRTALSGGAVADTIHLLAELIENSVMFSPPDATVEVTGTVVSNGFVLEIEDRGLGMTEELREELNGRLASAPEFDLFDSARLGTFVVARLAHRHDIKVSLRMSPYGGTSAIVFIPAELLTEPPPEEEAEPPSPALAATPEEPPQTVLGVAVRPPARPQPTGETHLGLPMRRRAGAGRPAPQGPPPAPAAPMGAAPAPGPAPGAERTPEQARAMMAAMQRGWQRGRTEGEHPAPTPEEDA